MGIKKAARLAANGPQPSQIPIFNFSESRLSPESREFLSRILHLDRELVQRPAATEYCALSLSPLPRSNSPTHFESALRSGLRLILESHAHCPLAQPNDARLTYMRKALRIAGKHDQLTLPRGDRQDSPHRFQSLRVGIA